MQGVRKGGWQILAQEKAKEGKKGKAGAAGDKEERTDAHTKPTPVCQDRN